MNSTRSRRDCRHYREWISMFIDTELESDSQQKLFKHLAVCDECQEFLDVQMKFKVARQNDEIEYPIELDSMIFEELKVRKNVYALGKIDPPAERVPFWRRRVALSVPTAAALVMMSLLSVGTFMYAVDGKILPIRQSIISLLKQERQYEKVFVVQEAYVYPQPVYDIIAAKPANKTVHPEL